MRFGEVLFKALHVAPVRAAPGVDRLIGITHAENIFMIGSKLSYECVLCQIGILKFIHEYMTETLGIFVAHSGQLFKQARGVHKDVIKVHGVAGDKSLLIFDVNALYDFIAIGVGWVIIRTDDFILGM